MGQHVSEAVFSPEFRRYWFDIGILYIRVTALSYTDDSCTPETLSFKFPPRESHSCGIELNSVRVSCSESVCLSLRRDRVDQTSAEAIYVSTDRLKVTGSLEFEVLHEQESLLSGTLDRLESLDDHGKTKLETRWSLDCTCTIHGSGCIFLKGKHGNSTRIVPPSMEVCIVGKFLDVPVILTQTVLLTTRRRGKLRNNCTLESIPESAQISLDIGESDCNVGSALIQSAESAQVFHDESEADFKSLYGIPFSELSNYGITAYGEGEEPEMSWFNAGVRVGVGLGLGMCLGVGIGVGIILRSYQSATRTLRRQLL